MKPNKVIERLDALRPNPYSEEQKLEWINNLEEMVQRLVMQSPEIHTLSYPEDMDEDLLITAPFDNLYGLYLESMIDYYNREYSYYNNSALMFETRFTEYRKAYIRGDSTTSYRTEEKTVTPTKAKQEVTPTEARYLKKVTVNPIPDRYIEPSGTLDINENGNFDVTEYANVSVDVPNSVQSKTVYVDKNGSVVVTPDSGAIGLSSVEVNVAVPVPEGFIKPSGSMGVSENGIYDITQYESVIVAVPETIPEGYIEPIGTKIVTANGTYDIREFENVAVDVPSSGIQPSGLYDITDTSMHDVSSYQYAVVSDVNLSASNIKKDVSILGVVGTYEGEGGNSAVYLIQAGTYQMTSYYYEDSYSGAFAWGSQDLKGKLTCTYNGKTDQPFTSMSNDGECYIYFYNDGSQVGDISPSWGSYFTTKITLDEAQLVSEAFKAWWDKSFTAVENGGGGSTSGITQAELRSGYYRNDDQNYYPLGYQHLPMNNGNSYSYSADVVGDVDDTIFSKITIEGGDGMNEAPYATAYFKNSVGDVVATFYSQETSDYRKISISNYTNVPIEFYTIFNGMFMYGVYTG